MRFIFFFFMSVVLGLNCQASLTMGGANAMAEFNNIAVSAAELGDGFFAGTAKPYMGGRIVKGNAVTYPGSSFKGVYLNNIMVDVGEISTIKQALEQLSERQSDSTASLGKLPEVIKKKEEGVQNQLASGIAGNQTESVFIAEDTANYSFSHSRGVQLKWELGVVTFADKIANCTRG